VASHRVPTSSQRGSPSLARELGLFGATWMGLGSIIGTGVFVGIGIAVGIAGPAVIPAIVLAAGLAVCNGLNSAQLAAAHPVSGGTYEYGYQFLRPSLGFTAGWMFLSAKTASAATAALGFAGYLLNVVGMESTGRVAGMAVLAVAVLTAIAAAGIRQSNLVNIVMVSTTVLALLTFIVAGAPVAWAAGSVNLRPLLGENWSGLFHATALMFVAYTGYGRIATLGEEVRHPKVTIPRAMILTLTFSAVVYVAVATIGIAAVGAEMAPQARQQRAAPLAVVAGRFPLTDARWIVAIGAMTAMLGVLLNLILGLSRVLLAMGRRGDAPRFLARTSDAGASPYWAVLVVGALVAALAATGNFETTWSFSAFSVLVYYAITNLAALRLPDELRLYSRELGWVGLGGCLFLAFWVEWPIWAAGVAWIAVGLVWHAVATGRRRAV
jgi:APA family basic amino acid/polyamine antiporter